MKIKEDKELLIKDLCARLPYKPTVLLYEKEKCILSGIDGCSVYLNINSDLFPIENVRPYLRPMSSITKKECRQLFMLLPKSYIIYSEEIHNIDEITKILPEHIEIITDFYNSHHLDWRGLINKGLAIEAPKDMYKF